MVSSSGSPDEDKLLAWGKTFYATLDTHEMADFMAFFTDDTVYVDYASPGEIKGRKAMGALTEMYLKALPDLHQTPLANQWALGDLVISEVVTQGTLKGALGPLRPTGKPVAIHFLDILQVKDGKIVMCQSYSNSLEFLTQAGVIKPPEAKK
jgi:ketosteroid isomerase-like protein